MPARLGGRDEGGKFSSVSSSACRAERSRVVVRVRGMRDDDDEGMTRRKVRGGGGGALRDQSRVRCYGEGFLCFVRISMSSHLRVEMSTHSLLFGDVETLGRVARG